VGLPVRAAGDARTANRVLCEAGRPSLELNPGRVDPRNPAFSGSRKPLAGEFTFRGETFFVIGVHLSSKGGDDPLFGRAQPPVLHSAARRIEQARAVNAFVVELLACDPDANAIVLGDTNDFQFSAPIQALQGDELYNLMDLLPENERYSYLYEGNSQVLDQALVSEHVWGAFAPEYDVVHVNAEFKASTQVSDHDPAVVGLTVP
jgi:predicted extracellular nuclease